jgi:hypothetical protein
MKTIIHQKNPPTFFNFGILWKQMQKKRENQKVGWNFNYKKHLTHHSNYMSIWK